MSRSSGPGGPVTLMLEAADGSGPALPGRPSATPVGESVPESLSDAVSDETGGVVDVVPELLVGGGDESVVASSPASHPASATDTREARSKGVYFMTSIPLVQRSNRPLKPA